MSFLDRFRRKLRWAYNAVKTLVSPYKYKVGMVFSAYGKTGVVVKRYKHYGGIPAIFYETTLGYSPSEELLTFYLETFNGHAISAAILKLKELP